MPVYYVKNIPEQVIAERLVEAPNVAAARRQVALKAFTVELIDAAAACKLVGDGVPFVKAE